MVVEILNFMEFEGEGLSEDDEATSTSTKHEEEEAMGDGEGGTGSHCAPDPGPLEGKSADLPDDPDDDILMHGSIRKVGDAKGSQGSTRPCSSSGSRGTGASQGLGTKENTRKKEKKGKIEVDTMVERVKGPGSDDRRRPPDGLMKWMTPKVN